MPDKTAPSTAPEESQVAVTPDEEVAARAKELDELRAEIQKARDDRARREADLSHELRMSDLDIEKARLQAELANEKRLNEKLDISSDSSFDNAEAAMAHAVAQMEGTAALKKAEEDAVNKVASDAADAPLTGSPVPDGAEVPSTSSATAKSSSPTTAKAAK